MLIKRKDVNHKAAFIMLIYIIIVLVAFLINAIVSGAIECIAYGLILFSGGFLVCFYMVEAYYKIEDVPKRKESPKRKR